MPRRFAISDIHGCKTTFQALLEKINFAPDDRLYLLGDYIDRGPDSRGVIDHIWKLQSKGYDVFCLKGNHEQMMLDSLTNVETNKHWQQHGGLNTLKSFSTDRLDLVPEKYIAWLKSLPHFICVDKYILVHAGLNFKVSAPLEDQKNMLWMRDWYNELDRKWLGGRIIVHGHTPIIKKEMETMLSRLNHRPVLDIDGGCVFREDRFRRLVAYNLDEMTLHFQKNVEQRGKRKS